jgi:penicillin-binding protein 2
VPYSYGFNGRLCDNRRFEPNYTPALLSEGNLQIVRQGMRATVEVGTGNPANQSIVRYDGLNVRVAGKSGTAEYCDNIAWSRALCKQGNWPAHAWFAAYAPWDDPSNDDPTGQTVDRDTPEILVVAMVYNGEEGARYALPIVNDVIAAYYRLQLERNGGVPGTITAQVP